MRSKASCMMPPRRELTIREIGEMIMQGLKKLDKVAYVRFASVYMDFKDVQEFMSELKKLVERPFEKIARLEKESCSNPSGNRQ